MDKSSDLTRYRASGDGVFQLAFLHLRFAEPPLRFSGRMCGSGVLERPSRFD